MEEEKKSKKVLKVVVVVLLGVALYAWHSYTQMCANSHPHNPFC